MTAQMAGASASAGPISITRAYIPLPASPDVAVLYFTATDTTDTAVTLTGVSTDGAASADFHTYVDAPGGGQTMADLSSITVPAHGHVTLAPDHMHVMLENPHALKVGDTVHVTIDIQGGTPITLAVPVVPMTGLQTDMPGMHMGG